MLDLGTLGGIKCWHRLLIYLLFQREWPWDFSHWCRWLWAQHGRGFPSVYCSFSPQILLPMPECFTEVSLLTTHYLLLSMLSQKAPPLLILQTQPQPLFYAQVTLQKPCSQLHETVLASGEVGPRKHHKVRFLPNLFQIYLCVFACVHRCVYVFARACVDSKTTSAIIFRDVSHVLWDRVFHLLGAHQLG